MRRRCNHRSLFWLMVALHATTGCNRSEPNASVANALDHPDPCAVRTLKPTDRNRASAEQQRLLDIREADCSRREALALCDSLVSRLADGGPTEDDMRGLGDRHALIERIRSAALVASDLVLVVDQLPCGTRMLSSFVRAARESADAWAHAAEVSDRVRLFSDGRHLSWIRSLDPLQPRLGLG
jgi:hypothetical protein